MENTDVAADVLRTYAESSRSTDVSRVEECNDRWISGILADSLRLANTEIARLRHLNELLVKEKEIMKTEYERNHELMTKAYEVQIKQLEQKITELTPERPSDEDIYEEMISGVGYSAEVYKKELDIAIRTFKLDEMGSLESKRQRKEAARHILSACGVTNPSEPMKATVRRKLSTLMASRKRNGKEEVQEKKREYEKNRRLAKRQRTSSENETSMVEVPPVSDDSGVFDQSAEEEKRDDREEEENADAAFCIDEGGRKIRFGKILKLYENQMRVMLYDERDGQINLGGKTEVKFVRRDCLLYPNITIIDGKVIQMEMVKLIFDGKSEN